MSEKTTNELMHATYRALCKHGYANLTMQDIADESTKSKSSLHYYYDTKQDLFVSFLSFLYGEFEDRLRAPENENPRERLVAFIDAALTPPERDEQLAFQTAFLEIKTQVPYNEGFSERIAQFDDLLHEQCRSIVAEGIEAGVFREADPEAIATFFVTLFNGDQVLWVTENQSSDITRQLFVDYIESQLLADDAPEVLVE